MRPSLLRPTVLAASVAAVVAGGFWIFGAGSSGGAAAERQGLSGASAAGRTQPGAGGSGAQAASSPAAPAAPMSCSTALLSPFGAASLSEACEDERARSVSTFTPDDPDAPQIIAAQMKQERELLQRLSSALQEPSVVDERTFDLSTAVSGCVSAPQTSFWDQFCEQVLVAGRARRDQLVQLQNTGDAEARALTAHALYSLLSAQTSQLEAGAAQPLSADELQSLRLAAALRAQLPAPPAPSPRDLSRMSVSSDLL